MIELIRHQHARRLRATLVWGASFGLLGAMMVGVFSTLDVTAFRRVVDAYPPALLEAFGVTGESFTTPEGFIAGELLSFLVPLAIGFYPILAAARAMAGAEEDRSLDLLLSQPVPRWQIPVATFAAFTVGLVEIVLLFALVTWLSAVAFGVDLALGDMLAGAVNLVPLSLIYGAFALAVSAAVRQPGLVTAAAGGALVLGYLTDTVGRVARRVDWMADVTPFRFYGSAIERGLHVGDIAALSAGALALLAISVPLFAARDVRA